MKYHSYAIFLGMRAALILLSSLTLISSVVFNVEARTAVKVNADSVNLRSGAGLNSEVVSQVKSGDVLVAIDPGLEWVEVVPPSSVSLWVYAELVKDGVVAVSTLRVRAGPGINYKSVGKLVKDNRVSVRSTKGEWLEIAPPEDCRLWISSKYIDKTATKIDNKITVRPSSQGASRVKVLKPPMPVNQSRISSATAPSSSPRPSSHVIKTTRLTPTVSREPVAPQALPVYVEKGPRNVGAAPVATQTQSTGPLAENLVSGVQQGRIVEKVGLVKKAGLVWRRPSKYRLVNRDKRNRAVTACYIMGSEPQMLALIGHNVVVTGREYWVQGVRYPVIVVDSIASSY